MAKKLVDVDKKYTKEQQAEAERAFAAYMAMDRKSLKALSLQIGIPPDELYMWNRDFRWAARIPAVEKQVSQRMLDKAIRTNADRRAKNLEIADNLADQLLELVKAEQLEIKNAQDAERIIKIVQLLIGEATDRVEAKGVTDITISDAATDAKRVVKDPESN